MFSFGDNAEGRNWRRGLVTRGTTGQYRGNHRGRGGGWRNGQTSNLDQRQSVPTSSARGSNVTTDVSVGDGSLQNRSDCYNCKNPGYLARDCTEPKSDHRGGGPDKNGRPTFGFKRLYGFLTADESDSVILAIGRNIPEWTKLIESSPSMSSDFFPLLLHILAQKVCTCETILAPNQVEIITYTFQDHFTKQLQKQYSSMFMGEPPNRSISNGMDVDQSRLGILRSVHTLFSFVAFRCPLLARDYVGELIPGAIGVLSTMAMMPTAKAPVAEVQELLEKFRQLMGSINMEDQKRKTETVLRKKFNKYQLTELEETALHEMAPPEDFRDISIIPSIQEILSTEEPFLRTNKMKGRYDCADHYLDVQYRLLREDFVNPLRKGIQDFMKNRVEYLSRKKKMPIGSVRIYPGVNVKNVELIGDALTYKMQLAESDYGRIRWEKSKRLLNGSLLVFTPDNFNTAFFGIVAQRDVQQLKEGILGIKWEGDVPDLSKPFLMVECEVYFEAYRHTLEILKIIELDTFPLSKFIIEASGDVCAPNYMEEALDLMLIGSKYISPLIGPWPTANELGFDENQFLAYQAALTNEFSIIQGPPGTGKTYLGLRVAETFLMNLSAWWNEGKGPILVVCYTNHALDQFLEGILKILKRMHPRDDPGLIRVGGRSKCEALDEFSLMKKRITAARMRFFDHSYWQAQNEAKSAVMELGSKRAALLGEAVALGNLEGIVNFDSLGCSKKLKAVTSSNVLSAMKNPEWFGLNDGLFINSSDPAALLQTLFGIRIGLQNQPANTVLRQAAAPPAPSEEDDEDYDLDELLAERVEEEFPNFDEVEFEMSTMNVNGGKIEYMEPYSISFCKAVIKKAQKTNGLGNPAKKLKQQQQAQEVQRLTLQVILAENRMNFLELLMRAHKEGLLQLPSITDFIEPQNHLSLQQLNRLTLLQKWSIYFAVAEKARTTTLEATTEINKALGDAHKKLEAIRRNGDGQILRKTKVVGMTTTGAAKNHDLLQMMKSKIVIVEEAAEVLESHIVTCITKHCQQLILIGDHQQLRPSTTVYDLSIKYHLDISLFERMLNNNLSCYRLKVQHRMRPEIADLVVGTIYNELKNHSSVYDYPDVKGMDKNLFFINHQELENSESDSMSKSNKYEATFLAGLCRHLILQGYAASDITVLTTYTGQMFLLKKEISSLISCSNVRITCVDNYQGEENKVILLSLVRSNEQNNIGFLKTDNRICVAISRAKHGLYIIGNMSSLSSRSKTWVQIKNKLTARNEIGEELKLICEIHGNITTVKNAANFKTKAPEGGCNLLCHFVLKCTHVCESVCHVNDREHELYKCRKPCLKFCKSAHPCKSRCHVSCPPCDVKMEKTLPCQHVLKMPCHMEPATVNCMVLVEKQKPCGHKEQMVCSNDPAKIKCREVVVKTLPCTHVKTAECHIDPASITCRVNVTKVLVPCGHEQIDECHKHPEMISCETDVEKEFPDCKHKITVKCKDSKNQRLYCRLPCPNRLDCGHQCTKICHAQEDPNHVTYQCKKECARQCANGHPCRTKHQCCRECFPCEVIMEKVHSCGVHKMKLACKMDVDSVLCPNPCARRVTGCNHKCLKTCYEECDPCYTKVRKCSPCGHAQYVKCSEDPKQAYCEQRVLAREFSACQHEALVPCKLKETISPTETMKYCESPCGYQFQDEHENGCNHRCKGTCSGCSQGRLHKKCQEECGKMLVCGHVCGFPCGSTCPPCRERCFMKCEHSACQATCGEPCTDCKEKCTWKCKHKACSKLCGEDCDREPCDEPCDKILKCGHPCIGFCGEPCPPLCRLCNKEELTEFILYGLEEEEDARFVYLEDCKHTIEVEGLTHHMGMQAEEGLIAAKACPRCKTVVRHSRRFGNVIRRQLKDVMAVKERVFGNQEIVQRKQRELLKDIRAKADWIETLCIINPNVRRYFVDKLAETVPPTILNPEGSMKLRKVPAGTMQSLEVIVKYGKDVLKIYKESEQSLRKEEFDSLMREYRRLLEQIITRELPLTKTEIENFENEFDRHYDIGQLFKRRASRQFAYGAHATAMPLYTRGYNLLISPRVYSDDMKQQVRMLLKELDDKLQTGLGINERERHEILAAINMRQGRWYKCPNGHIYLITECGGANGEGICNECGATIGGHNHRVRSDNQFAPEMDGAAAPIWPQ